MKITGRGTTAGWKVLAAGQTSPHLIFREIYNVDVLLYILLAVLKFFILLCSPLSWFHTRSSRWRDWVIFTEFLKPLSFLPFGRRNVNNSEYSSLFIFQDSCRAQTLPPSIPCLPPLLTSLCNRAAGGELVHRLVGRVVPVEELSEGESRNKKSASHHF